MQTKGSVRLNLLAKIGQPWNIVFLSQQISISISINQKYSQPNTAKTYGLQRPSATPIMLMFTCSVSGLGFIEKPCGFLFMWNFLDSVIIVV
jgi:hypothetical protein